MTQSDIINNNFNKVLKCIKSSNAYVTGEVSDELKGYSQLAQIKHSTFDSSKITIVETPTITDDGVVSDFSTSNYIKTPNVPELSKITESIRFTSSFVYNTISAEQTIWNRNLNFDFRLNNGSIILRTYDGSKSNAFSIPQSQHKVVNGEQVFCDVVITSNLCRIKINGVEYTKAQVTDFSYLINMVDKYFYIGMSNTYDLHFQTSIDLKQFSITVDGKEVFNGNKTGIDVIKDNDYTVIGSPTISADGIVSNYSKNNAIKTNISATPTTSLRIKSSYTWNTDESATLDNICVPYVLGTSRWRLDFRIVNNTLSVYCTNDLDTSTNTKFNIPITDLPANNAKIKVEEIITKTSRTVNVKINGTTYTGTTTFASEQAFEQIQLTLGNASLTGNSDYLWCGTQDLNEFLVYVDDNLVYQPCLKIPYTQSKTGSKIVDAVYRDRVIDLYEQTGIANYYTLDEANQNYTLPMGEIYGMLNNIASNITAGTTITYWGDTD